MNSRPKQYTSTCVTNFRNSSVVINDEVANALEKGRNVVALETTIVVHGLPAPANLEVAEECETAVRDAGSVPATIGVLDGRVVVGLSADRAANAGRPGSTRGQVVGPRPRSGARQYTTSGATTVAGTITIASRVGIEVMATGGLGGVHRDVRDSFDESADLTALSRNQAPRRRVRREVDTRHRCDARTTRHFRSGGRRISNGPVSRLLSEREWILPGLVTRGRDRSGQRRFSRTANCRPRDFSSPIRSTRRVNSPLSCTIARCRARSKGRRRSA